MKKKLRDIIQFLLILVVLVLVNVIGNFAFHRFDLTSENRYSLNEATLGLLDKVDDRVLFKVYLEGDLEAGFQKLQRETRQMLDEIRAYNRNIEYEFINPSESSDRKEREETYQQLRFKGLQPIQVEVEEKDGQSRRQIFPGALVSYKEQEVAIQILVNQFATSPESQINASVENLEYTLANALRRLTLVKSPSVAVLSGHGELGDRYVADLMMSLSTYYNITRFNLREFVADSITGNVSIQQQMRRLNSYDGVIIAKPTKPFSELDKYLIDQYVMNGGKTLWFIDAVHAEMDSLSYAPQFMAFPIIDQLGLGDMLFRYGVRVNTNLVQDAVAGGVNDRRGVHKWVYFPLIMPQVKHPITKDLNAIRMEFVSTVDTIISPGVKKKILLRTSPYSKAVPTPHIVSLRTLYEPPPDESFRESALPVGVLLEGSFTSMFRNRITPKGTQGESLPLKEKSSPTQMLVVADGDLPKNQVNLVNPNLERGAPLPLGYDQFTGMQFGNKDFILNAVDFMLDDTGLINIRSRELKLRLLDFQKIKGNEWYWKALNTALPVLAVVLFGLFFHWNRKRKFTKKIA
ncbi:MAG: gliding motility-associated ABC transporter substrate-binding protein GldG [Bacteroidota bacterium]|nr:gliding motility-associated ABC transporter substrate-binding protein GldG [Bacteroidota bacterium]